MKHVLSTALCALFAITLAAPVLAAKKVPMPATAKLLTKDEIMAAYAGKKVIWTHPNGDGMTGFVNFNADMTKASGGFKVDGYEGTFESKPSFKGNLYCHATTKLDGKKFKDKGQCVAIYKAGDKFFENDPKTGKNQSVNYLAK